MAKSNSNDNNNPNNKGEASSTSPPATGTTTNITNTATSTATTTTTTTSAPTSLNLNVYQKIAVVRHSHDTLQYEDAQGQWKTVSVQELGDAISKATPLETKRVKLDIPVPRINEAANYHRDVPATYELPTSFVRYQKVTTEEWQARCDYVADAEDETWWDSKREWKDRQLSLEMLEVMLDALEKATGFETIITFVQAEALLLQKLPQLYYMFPVKRPKQHQPQPSQVQPLKSTLKQVLNDVYQYWIQKRSKLKRPLLRKFWPVTSTDDTNPHLVFRPREKEKYKLRKKRQNDLDAYLKLKQLRNDFDNLRAIMDLAKRREQLSRLRLQCQIELFQHRLVDLSDTSTTPFSPRIVHDEEAASLLQVPLQFDFSGRKAKRFRSEIDNSSQRLGTAQLPSSSTTGDTATTERAQPSTKALNIAGRNSGEPAPNFLHPLATRETYATSWESAVPHVPSYENTHVAPTFYFRHRPRIGRGGRICIDRLPMPPPSTALSAAPPVVFRAGRPLPIWPPKERLLDFLPRPLPCQAISLKIQAMALQQVAEEISTVGAGDVVDAENDGHEVLVKVDEWLDTDDPLWGEERFAIGPI